MNQLLLGLINDNVLWLLKCVDFKRFYGVIMDIQNCSVPSRPLIEKSYLNNPEVNTFGFSFDQKSLMSCNNG